MLIISFLIILALLGLLIVTAVYAQLDTYKEDLQLLENYYSHRKV
jgi:hypothetical protein